MKRMSNQEIAAFFKTLADLLEIRGDNPFRIRAYRNAARTIETSGYDFTRLVAEGADLSKLPDIGERIAKKIEEIITTGHLKKLEEVQKEFPPGILDLLKIEGIGPKRARLLYEKLGIGSLEELKKAAEEHRIRELPGFDEKLEQKILKGVVLFKKEGKRFLFAEAEPYAEALRKHLSSFEKIDRITIAGSYRRRRATVGDLDIVITSEDPLGAMDHFVSFPEIGEVVSKGDTRSTIILRNNLQVDLRCVSPQSYGAALHYFTGSKPHNIAVRKMAMERGWKVNEYGVFDPGMQRLAGETEEEIYRLFDMEYIEPELREDRGELEAAKAGTLPRLVEREELRGDLHLHSSFGTGKENPESLVAKARELGYDYLAICDRAGQLLSAHGREGASLDAYLEELGRLDGDASGLRVLKGVEVEILEDGSLGMEDRLLERFDWVVAAIDEAHDLDEKRQTERLLRALSHPAVDALAHPTGRILGKKNGLHFDLDAVIDAAARHGVALEIDSRPDRLDLDDVHIRRAIEAGAPLLLSSVAETAAEMERIRYGLYQARRGWAEAKHLLNTLPLKTLMKKRGKRS